MKKLLKDNNKKKKFKHTFRVIPIEEINRERSQAYKYLV